MGYPKRALRGHSHTVQDVVISSDGQFCLTGSWDGTLRLWDISTGATTRRFLGHTKDVLSVAFSADNRQVCGEGGGVQGVGGRQPRGLQAAKRLAILPYPRHPPCTLSHAAICLSPPRPHPRPAPPPHSQIVSGSRDKTIKLWNTLGECKYTIGEPDGHTEWVSCVRFSPVTQNPIIVSAGWDKAVKVRTDVCVWGGGW